MSHHKAVCGGAKERSGTLWKEKQQKRNSHQVIPLEGKRKQNINDNSPSYWMSVRMILSTLLVIASLYPGLTAQAWDLGAPSASQPKQGQHRQSTCACLCTDRHLFCGLFDKVRNILGQLTFATEN